MTYAESILPEFDQEMASTWKVLECVPEDKLDWRAHPKSNTIGWNANHLAEIPGWVEGMLTAPSWDFAHLGMLLRLAANHVFLRQRTEWKD
jgi:DinB superfamily